MKVHLFYYNWTFEAFLLVFCWQRGRRLYAYWMRHFADHVPFCHYLLHDLGIFLSMDVKEREKEDCTIHLVAGNFIIHGSMNIQFCNTMWYSLSINCPTL